MSMVRSQRKHGQAQGVLIRTIGMMFAKFRLPKNLCWGAAFLVFSSTLFGQTNFTISVTADPDGAGNVTGGGSVAAGSTNTVTATTNAGYAFINWTLGTNGEVASSTSDYTFVISAALPPWSNTAELSSVLNNVYAAGTNVQLVANFGPGLTVNVSASPAGDGTVSGGGTFASNQSITVTAAPNNGYTLTNWTLGAGGPVVSTSNSYTFTLTSNVDLVANFAPNPLMPQGSEFSVLGAISGDQVRPSLSLSSSGGCLVWQDTRIDKSGGGIGGVLLNDNFLVSQPFRVNKVATGLVIKPQVQMLANGNIIFVWQGSVSTTSLPYIYARFCKASGAFYTSDIRVNTFTTDQQEDPAVAALPDGSAIITWSSYAQNGLPQNNYMWGVYARRLEANGKGTTPKQFLVTQYTSYNQRNPAVATLAGGNYVIVWVSEQERFVNSVDVYARIFSPSGTPLTDEIPVNSGSNICHSPSVAPQNDGGFTVVWAQKDAQITTNGWDVWGRSFSSSGAPENSDYTVNTTLYGDQYQPKIAGGPSGSMVVWTSVGQGGSRDNVFGRFLQAGQAGLQPAGAEFQISSAALTASEQKDPAVAWDGVGHFLAVWASFVGASGFDLYGQAYVLNSQ